MGCNPVFAEYLMGHTVSGIHSHYLVHSISEIYSELQRIEEAKKQKSWHTYGIPEGNEVALEVCLKTGYFGVVWGNTRSWCNR
jgi:hypothetical protein